MWNIMAVPSALVPIWYEARTSSPHPHSLQLVLRVGGNFIILTGHRPGMLAGWLAGWLDLARGSLRMPVSKPRS